MHTYKDAILETQGAYLLYPGDEDAVFKAWEDEPIIQKIMNFHSLDNISIFNNMGERIRIYRVNVDWI